MPITHSIDGGLERGHGNGLQCGTTELINSRNPWIFRGMPITHSEVKPIICSEANRSSIPRHADQWFRGQADQEFRAVGMI